jgi:hypothetical protein
MWPSVLLKNSSAFSPALSEMHALGVLLTGESGLHHCLLF